MTTHQSNVAILFKSNSSRFVTYLFTPGNKLTVIDDLFPQVVTFINLLIKNDLKNYIPQTNGYNRLTDMLIEINITKPRSELWGILAIYTDEAFRGQLYS